MTTPPGLDTWDLARVQQIVTQNVLERGRIEYKRELTTKALEAISALANTFGGVVLIGVDEAKQGLDRLVGVPASDRTRLVSWCWSQLTPPYSPEIIPISLGHDDLYILAVIVNTDYARRPIMLNHGNRVFVRLEDQNQAPDWYRLRDLFTEQTASVQDPGMPPADPSISMRQGEYPDVDLVVRGRLLLSGAHGRPSQITGPARAAALIMLNSNETPLSGAGSALSALMFQMGSGGFNSNPWHLNGLANIRQFSARWQGRQGLGPTGRILAEARIRVEIKPRPTQSDSLLVTLDALLTDPRPNLFSDLPDNEETADPKADLDAPSTAAADASPPFIGIGALRKLMLDITGTLWGPPAETLSTGILGQPLGPPALLDLTIFTTPIRNSSVMPPLNEVIDFGRAHLIADNTPGSWTNLGPIQPDRTLLSSPAAQAPIIYDWLIQFGIDNGYQDIEQEVGRWTGIPTE
jgi:hypothetical protein